jgi:hypothetical protein
MAKRIFQHFLSGLEKITGSPGRVFLFVVLFSVAYFMLAHEGFYWIDDYGYAKYAWEVKEGTFSITQNSAVHPNNPLTHRVLIFGPVAFFYKLFGITIYTTTLWPLLCTLGCSGLIYLLFRKDNPRVAVFGMVLLGLYFHALFLASYLYPDNILMFFSFAAAAVLYKVHFRENDKNLAGMALLFVLANFGAFLSKETIVYFLPFYGWLFVLSFFRKKDSIFWAWSFLFGAFFLAAYFTFYHFRTGDWLYRFHIIEETNHDMQDGNFIKATPQAILNRITIGPVRFFIGSGLAVPLVFALGLFRKFNRRDFLTLKNHASFWLGLALVVLLQFWFGSTSFREYNPITLLPRMVTPLVPPLCLAAAFGLQRILKNDAKVSGIYTLLFLGICFLDRSNTLAMYVPLALFFGFCWWSSRKAGTAVPFTLVVLVLAGVLSLRPLHFMRKESVMAFREQDSLVKKYLDGNQGKNLVLGDRWLHFMYDFHYQFRPNPHYFYRQFLDPEDFSNYDQVFLLVNRGSLSNPDMAKWQAVQEPELYRRFPQKKLLDQKGKVLLYKLK